MPLSCPGVSSDSIITGAPGTAGRPPPGPSETVGTVPGPISLTGNQCHAAGPAVWPSATGGPPGGVPGGPR
eukprot:717993-Hanusia_phi.AAC.4